MKTWTELCQDNVNRYHRHPVATTASAVVYVGAVYVGLHKALQKMAKNDLKNRSGQMANKI